MRKFNLLILAFVIAIVLTVLAGYYYFLVRPLPRVEGEVWLPGLKASVQVIRDNWGMPHIYAQNEHDLFFAQGFVQAQDRLWQMDLNRRMAQGRLSEIFGPAALDADKLLRTFGIYEAARRDLKVCDEERLKILQQFSRGVNAYINLNMSSLPLEFSLLRYTPEPWSPVDSLAWAKMMALSGGRNWEEEIVRMLLLQKVGSKRAAELIQVRGKGTFCTIPGFVKALSLNLPKVASSSWSLPFPLGGASNNWVVSGNKTATGSPILANDMHLNLSIPSIWYEMHLVGGRYNVLGLTLPGIPLVIAGHNRDVAWGITYAYVDVQDLYLEKTHSEKKDHFLFNGQWVPAKKIRSLIRIKGRQEPVVHWIWKTRHGPLISREVPILKRLGLPVSLRWSALEPGFNMKALQMMNLASSAQEFEKGARLWCEPAINLVYADRKGRIGYVAGSRIPIRHEIQGPIPVSGHLAKIEWKGWIAPEQKPGLSDPEEGFIITANNCIAGQDYPYYLAVDYSPGYRAKRIRELLKKLAPISVADCATIQADLKCLPAEAFVQTVINTMEEEGYSDQLLTYLKEWDKTMTPKSRGAAIYSVLFQRMLDNTFSDELGDLASLFFGKSLIPLAHLNRFSTHSRVALHRLMEWPDSPWFDNVNTPERETLFHVLLKSLRETKEFLKTTLGQDPEKWRWGRLHSVEFVHPLGRVRLLNKIFNLGPFEGGGNFHTVSQSAISPGLEFKLKAWAVSNRHIYDLADWDRSLGSIVPGQSGHRASPHYSDQMELWLDAKHHPLPYSKKAVKIAAKHILFLSPDNLLEGQ